MTDEERQAFIAELHRLGPLFEKSGVADVFITAANEIERLAALAQSDAEPVSWRETLIAARDEIISLLAQDWFGNGFRKEPHPVIEKIDAALAQSDAEPERAQLRLEEDAQGKRAMLGGYQMSDALIPSLEAQFDAEPLGVREKLAEWFATWTDGVPGCEDAESNIAFADAIMRAFPALAQSDAEPHHKQLLDLSGAYLRLRALIPGAFDTPHAPSPETIWQVTEDALKKCMKRLSQSDAEPVADIDLAIDKVLMFRLERMDDGVIWIRLYRENGDDKVIWLNSPSTITANVEDDKDEPIAPPRPDASAGLIEAAEMADEEAAKIGGLEGWELKEFARLLRTHAADRSGK